MTRKSKLLQKLIDEYNYTQADIEWLRPRYTAAGIECIIDNLETHKSIVRICEKYARNN